MQTVLGKPADPKLPATDVDIALLHDVLHHVEDKSGYLSQVVRYLTPAGRVAIVEFDGPKGPHSGQPEAAGRQGGDDCVDGRISGFVPSEDISLFPRTKWYVIYAPKVAADLLGMRAIILLSGGLDSATARRHRPR